jgi:hypothetical protein
VVRTSECEEKLIFLVKREQPGGQSCGGPQLSCVRKALAPLPAVAPPTVCGRFMSWAAQGVVGQQATAAVSDKGGTSQRVAEALGKPKEQQGPASLVELALSVADGDYFTERRIATMYAVLKLYAVILVILGILGLFYWRHSRKAERKEAEEIAKAPKAIIIVTPAKFE